jgi:hypothetical protein
MGDESTVDISVVGVEFVNVDIFMSTCPEEPMFAGRGVGYSLGLVGSSWEFEDSSGAWSCGVGEIK